MAQTHRLNIYLEAPEVRAAVRTAAIRTGVSLSAYCLGAIRDRLADDGFLPREPKSPREAARALDELRRKIRPIGVPVSELIAEGRRSD